MTTLAPALKRLVDRVALPMRITTGLSAAIWRVGLNQPAIYRAVQKKGYNTKYARHSKTAIMIVLRRLVFWVRARDDGRAGPPVGQILCPVPPATSASGLRSGPLLFLAACGSQAAAGAVELVMTIQIVRPRRWGERSAFPKLPLEGRKSSNLRLRISNKKNRNGGKYSRVDRR
jgi:hypothetical protein